MEKDKWNAFCKFKSEYKNECMHYLDILGYKYKEPSLENCAAQSFKKENASFFKEGLTVLQEEAALAGKTPPYPVETPIVYNHAWDSITQDDEIKLIVIGDNPGKNEQLHKNQKYLVGLAGKIADNFFKKNPSFGIDFRKNVIILNKTPIHTAKTKQLDYILKKDADGSFKKFYEESQIFTAQKTAELQKKLDCPIWLVGYSELKPRGLFYAYANEMKNLYADKKEPEIYLYQHFSMNRFLIDLKDNYDQSLSLEKNLSLLGIKHRNEILDF